jgi:hypothetical protein
MGRFDLRERFYIPIIYSGNLRGDFRYPMISKIPLISKIPIICSGSGKIMGIFDLRGRF